MADVRQNAQRTGRAGGGSSGPASFTLTEGQGDTDNDSFTIDGDQLKIAESFDYETKDEYSIRVRGTDAGGLSIEKVFTINVSDANDAPIGITLSEDSVPENQKKGYTVGKLSGIDPDAGDKLTFTLVDDAADNAQFTLSGTSVHTAGPFDAEPPRSSPYVSAPPMPVLPSSKTSRSTSRMSMKLQRISHSIPTPLPRTAPKAQKSVS